MKLLATISDADFFSSVKEVPENLELARVVARVILVDDQKNVALVGNKHILLPGGGVDTGESLEVAAKRECLEEAGCIVDIVRELGKTDELRMQKNNKQETNCFIAQVIGEKGKPTSMQLDELGIETLWVSPEEAIKNLEKQLSQLTEKNYLSFFNLKHCLVFLNEYIKEL